jgi:oligopeptidase A
MNPLLEAHTLPPFSHIRPEHVLPAITTILAENRKSIEALAHAPATWANIPAVLETLNDRLEQAWSPVSHLNAVMNSEEWRKAYNDSLPLLSAYSTELGQNESLFNAYTQIEQSDNFSTFPPAQRKALQNALRDFRLSGIGLSAEKKKRFSDIAEKLSELSSRFADNVLDATQAWDLHLADDSRLAGLPDSAKALLATLAQQKNLDGYRITLDAPSYLAVMTYADDRELRKTVYTAFVTRASDQGPHASQFDNSSVMVDILKLRQEEAALLGYENYAEVSLATKMASSSDEVMTFLQQLAQQTKPGAQKEWEELCTFAQQKIGITDIQSWDVAYCSEKLKENKYAISQEDLKPYFPAPQVISGMLKIAEKLYGIQFQSRSDIEVWHPDVTCYEIRENDQAIALFYLDPYARQNKRGGAWMADCRTRRRLENGVLQNPVAFLTCNFNPPIDGKPALLTHDEVTTLFHEFGHGLHHMLSRVEVAAVSGINGVAWDAVELPSQFFENWCWDSEALALIACHVDTQETLPTELLNKLLAAKNFQSGLMMMRQLEFALFDMAIHCQTVKNATDIQQILAQTRQKTALMMPPAFNRFQHGFSHIFSGGYAAGYYSYKWAEVLSADAFSRFEEEGIMNAQTGKLFRDTILANGGSQDALDLFVAFRGRKPDIQALLRHSGLETKEELSA